MRSPGNALALLLALSGWGAPLVDAGEFCLRSNIYCPSYCCGILTCCSDCSRSVYYHTGCYTTYFYVGPIAGGIVSSIIFLSVVVFLVCLCCGCVCSSRTGIQRRGRVLEHSGGVHVVTASQVVYPQAPAGYPPPYPTAVQPAGYPPSGPAGAYQMPYPKDLPPPPYNAVYAAEVRY